MDLLKIANYEEDGILVVEYDKVARIRYDRIAGTSRPFTDEENAIADDEATRVKAAADHAVNRATVNRIITDLKAEKSRADEVIGSTSATQEDKKNARAIRRVADAAIDLARFVKDL